LFKALRLQAYFDVRSERQLMEQVSYNMLVCWFVGLSMNALALNDLSAAPVEPAKFPRPAKSNRPARSRAVRDIGGLPAHLPPAP
jgi:hypothetical protein